MAQNLQNNQTETNKAVLGTEPVFDISHISFSQKFLLGLQHTFAMFGATVLVPLITGLDVSTTLLFAGVGTLLFHFVTGGRVPTFLGSSFAFLAGYAAVAPDRTPEQLALAGGGVVCTGILYFVMAMLIKSFGVKRVMKFFPPVVTGPIIICIGLTLAPVAITWSSSNWFLAVCAIAIIVLANIWGRGMIKIIPILLGIFGAYIIALVTGNVDLSNFADKPFVEVPLHPQYFAVFDASAIITILPIALATMMEHVGDVSAVSATTGRNFIQNPGLHRTMIGDGLATSLAAFFGAPANTTYGENTGVLALTKVYDPRVVRYAAFFAIAFSFLPFINALINSIPQAIIGGVSFILYGMIASIGVRNVVENRVDLTKSRNLIVAATILVSGLGFANNPVAFTIGDFDIKLSGIAIAALVGIVLNAILPGKDFVFKVSEPQEFGAALSLSGADSTSEGLHKDEQPVDNEVDPTAPENQNK